MLRIDRTACFFEESLKLHRDSEAFFSVEFLRLHPEWRVRIHREDLKLLIDRDAQFCVEYRKRFFGISSEKTFRFHCKQGKRKIIYKGSWTEEQYLSLLAEQQEDPIPLTTDSESGRTWWMFQDKIYWEDYSEREVIKRQHAASKVLLEVKEHFFDGNRDFDAIVKKIFRLQYTFIQAGQEIQHDGFWTEEQYHSLTSQQIEDPVLLLTDNENARTWWMFRYGFYWGSEDLKDIEGKSLERAFRFTCESEGQVSQTTTSWTDEQYRSLLVQQQEEPVALLLDRATAKTWWMFQDNYYWEDFSLSVPEEIGVQEVKALFSEGSRDFDGISRKIYRSQRKLGGQKFHSTGFWTESQYLALLAKQQEDPVQVLSDRDSGKAWWIFRDKFYWEDEELKEIEVKALLLERARNREQQIRRAMRAMEQENLGHTSSTSIPDSVKRRVWERSRGHCVQCGVQCGQEGDLEYVHIIPISKGGSNSESNLQLLCELCAISSRYRDDYVL